MISTLDWEPEVFMATINNTGVLPHPEPADPAIPVFLAAEIAPHRFYKLAKYLPSANHDSDFVNTMYKWTADVIYLVADGSGDIFCIAFGPPFKIPMLFGKLCQDCEIYQICARAFGNIFAKQDNVR